MKTLHLDHHHHSTAATATPSKKVTDGDGEEEEDSIVGTSASRLVAPKATPEDSLIDSYSTTDDEDDEDEDYGGEAMQSEMLNRMDTRDEVLLEEVVEEEEEEEVSADAENAVMAKQLVLAQLTGVTQTQHLASGSSLPDKLPATTTTTEHPSPPPPPPPHSTACLIQPPPVTVPRRRAKNLTFTLSLSNPTKLNGDGRSRQQQRRRRIAPPLPPPIIQCRSCGLSPGSPTYYEHHSKWCHTGAHALDVFVSPDSMDPVSPWPSTLPSTSTQSPTTANHPPVATAGAAAGPSGVYRLPRVGADTPMRRLPLPHSSLTAAIHDFSDDSEDEDEVCPHRPLLASSPATSPPPPHIPNHKAKSLEKYKSSARDRRKAKLSPVCGSDPTLR